MSTTDTLPPETPDEAKSGGGVVLQRLVRRRWNNYSVWRQQHSTPACSQWILTGHTVKARTIKEARSKLERGFRGAGFSAMSLMAMPVGESPNSYSTEKIP